jgi:hypothetical protein
MDQSRDVSGQQLYRLTQLCPPPEFVKSASVEELCGDGLPPEAYGDPLHLLYPCHTAAATWASYAFLLDKKASLRPDDAELAEERILHCGRTHGITQHLLAVKEALAKAAATTGEAALSDEDFALVWDGPQGKERRYPLRNPTETKAAAQYLHAHRDQLPFEARQQFADRLLQKQAQWGVTFGEEVNDYVEKQAGHGACTAGEAAELILGRIQASRKGPGYWTPLQGEMMKLAKMIAERPSLLREPGARVKVAALVDQFDREHQLNGQYGPLFPRVEDVLFGLTREKMAAAAREHVSTTTGNIYKLADLEMVKLSEVRDYFGDSFAERMTSDGVHVDSEKAATFIATLPRNDAEELDRFMDSFGVKPMLKEASREATGVSDQYLLKLAAARRRAMATG